MFEALIKPMVESGLLNEEARTALNEAWEAKLNEAREQIRNEMREEFAGRYQHDKTLMVEALDKMVTDQLRGEIKEFHQDKVAIQRERVQAQLKLQENVKKIRKFTVEKLAEEIGEFRKDQKTHKQALARLEKFVVKALAEELVEFQADRRDLIETKVRLVSQAKKKLNELKNRFMARSARLVNESVTNQLTAELSQLRNDIAKARENAFGRKIFEAFASEFTSTHLNENVEIRKLMRTINKQKKVVAEAKQYAAKAVKLAESKDQELKKLNETNKRAAIMGELLSPLKGDKQRVMSTLLENVQTDRLKSAYEKYLPSVINESVPSTRKVLAESAVTGNKQAASPVGANENIIDIQRLAGLK